MRTSDGAVPPKLTRLFTEFSTASTEASEREILSTLERASGFLRSRLCEALPLKRIPELRFRCDPAAVFGTNEADAEDSK